MKNNFKFFSIVSVLLLASSIVLTGCMYAIAAENGDAKVYDMGSQISADRNIIVDDDTPTSQTELQKKFSAMYDISEDGKSITVISEEYLKEFWQSNYKKEVIHSLTTEEVYYIIQDSIRIYTEYEKVILSGFTSVSTVDTVAERFPHIEDQEISHIPDKSSLDRDKVESDIHTIIMYRLKALSSPKAFFTGADAIRFVGGYPDVYSSYFPETLFYIPGYSADTDRDYILSIMGGNTNFTDLERFSDLFMVSIAGEPRIEFGPMQGSGSLEVFPTESIYKIPIQDGAEINKNTGDVSGPDSDKNNLPLEGKETLYYFKLDTSNEKSSLMASNGKTEAEGTYANEGDAHILAFDGDFQYVLYYNGKEYVYAKGESNPIPGYEFEDEQSFVLDGDALIPIEG